MLKLNLRIYKKVYIISLRLGYEKPTAFALRASILDLIAFVRLSLFKTKRETNTKLYHPPKILNSIPKSPRTPILNHVLRKVQV
ncbi:hypothetical protein Hanom_Chr04g00279821 [Helianthus anomalus]